MIAGTTNAKKFIAMDTGRRDFICYEVITPHLKPNKQFKLVEKLNISPVIYKNMKKVNKKSLSNYP